MMIKYLICVLAASLFFGYSWVPGNTSSDENNRDNMSDGNNEKTHFNLYSDEELPSMESVIRILGDD